MDQQQQATQNIEAVKLLSDFAKWLVTIETTAIAAVGYVLTFHESHWRLPTSVLLAAGLAFSQFPSYLQRCCFVPCQVWCRRSGRVRISGQREAKAGWHQVCQPNSSSESNPSALPLVSSCSPSCSA